MRLQDLLKRADQNKNQSEHLFNIEYDQKILSDVYYKKRRRSFIK